MKNELLIDSNVLIYILQKNEKVLKIIDKKALKISYMSELEILSYAKITIEEENLIQKYLQKIEIIEMNSDIKNQTIRLRRMFNTKIADTIILATAKHLQLPILTADKQLKRAESEVEIILLDL